MTEASYTNFVKSIASAVCAVIAMLAHIFDWSPALVSQNFLDVVASLICSLGAAYWAVKHADQ